MTITLNGTTGITTPDVNVTAQSSNIVTTGNITAVDATLSGGVYVGGTAAANYLDDYEEGTWTPQISDGTNVGNFATVNQATYTKIGRVVTLNCRAVNINTSGLNSSSSALLTNLPFNPNGYWYGLVFWRSPLAASYVYSFVAGIGSTAVFYNSSQSTMIVSDLYSLNSDLFLSITYEIV